MKHFANAGTHGAVSFVGTGVIAKAMARATAPITVADADKFREEVSLHTLPGALRSLSGFALLLQGYLIVEGLFDAREVAALQATVESFKQNDLLYDQSTTEMQNFQLHEISECSALLRALPTAGQVPAVHAAVIAAAEVRPPPPPPAGLDAAQRRKAQREAAREKRSDERAGKLQEWCA